MNAAPKFNSNILCMAREGLDSELHWNWNWDWEWDWDRHCCWCCYRYWYCACLGRGLSGPAADCVPCVKSTAERKRPVEREMDSCMSAPCCPANCTLCVCASMLVMGVCVCVSWYYHQLWLFCYPNEPRGSRIWGLETPLEHENVFIFGQMALLTALCSGSVNKCTFNWLHVCTTHTHTCSLDHTRNGHSNLAPGSTWLALQLRKLHLTNFPLALLLPLSYSLSSSPFAPFHLECRNLMKENLSIKNTTN